MSDIFDTVETPGDIFDTVSLPKQEKQAPIWQPMTGSFVGDASEEHATQPQTQPVEGGNGIGFFEALAEDPKKFVSVLGSVVDAQVLAEVRSASKRLERNDYKNKPVRPQSAAGLIALPSAPAMTADKQRNKDADFVGSWLADIEEHKRRGYTFGGRVGQVLGEMPSFITDFVITGGAAGTAKKVAREAIEKVLKTKATSLAGRAAIGAGGLLASATMRTALTPQRTAEAYAERRAPQGVGIGKDGNIVFDWSDESDAMSFAKAWGDMTVEWFSEELGDVLQTGKRFKFVKDALRKKPFASKFIDTVYKQYHNLHPDVGKMQFIDNAFRLGGWHGYVDEIGEEYIGSAMRGALGITDSDKPMPERLGNAMWETIKDTPAMLTAFAVPGVVKGTLASAAGKAVDWAEFEGEEIPEELTGFYQPAPRVMPKVDVSGGKAVEETALSSKRKVGPVEGEAEGITKEEEATLTRLEKEEPVITSEEGDDEKVSPNMYIGNVTDRARKAWAEIFQQAHEAGDIDPSDIGPHLEGAFPTKRTQIDMTKAEASETLQQLEETMDEMLMSGESRTFSELASMRAMWGDIRELRSSLGKPVGQMPFRVVQGRGNLVVEIKNPTERLYAAIGGLSKKRLAEYSHTDLVTQEEAITAKLRAVAKAASAAYKIGAKDAVGKLRLQQRVLKAKQRTLQMVKDYRSSLVRAITKPVSERVDPLYADAIRIMSDAMDKKVRTDQVRRRLHGLMNALRDKPELARRMESVKSLNLLKRLGQVPLESISTEQLQELADERNRLSRIGKIERRLMKRKQQAGIMKAALIEQMKSKPMHVELRGRRAHNAGLYRKMLDGFRRHVTLNILGQYRPERFFHNLDGYARQSFTKLVMEPMKRLSIRSSITRNTQQKEYYDFLKQNDIDPITFMGPSSPVVLEDGEELKLSMFEKIGIYILGQEPTARGHLTQTKAQSELVTLRDSGRITEQQFYSQWFGYRDKMTPKKLQEFKDMYASQLNARRNLGLSEADVDSITREVESDEKAKLVADHMVSKLNERWDDILRISHEIGIDPRNLVKVGKYFPLLVNGVDYQEQDDLLKRALGQFIPESYMTDTGFLKSRKEGSKVDIELDAQMLYLHSMNEVTHFLTMAPMLSQLSHIMADKEFRNTLDDRTFGLGTKIMSQWIIDTARGRVVREQHYYSRLMHKLNRHGIVYALGYNVPVVLRQSISSLNAMAMNPQMIPEFIKSIVSTNHNTEEFDSLKAEVFALSKTVQERDMEHMLSDQWNKEHLRKVTLRAFGHGVRGAELSKAATAWIRHVDMWTVVHCWKSAFEVAQKNGASQDASVRYADMVIQRTQPMARPEDLPHFFRGGIIEQWLTLFSNQMNQNLNFWMHDIYGARKAGKITNAEVMYRVMMSHTLPAIVFGMISRGFAPPDEKQLAEDLLLYVGGTPMFFGRLVTGAITGWGNSLGLWDMIIEGPKEIVSGVKNQDGGDILKGAAKTIGALNPGFPTAQMVRTVEGLGEMANGTMDDPRRLFWSEWALEQGETSDED